MRRSIPTLSAAGLAVFLFVGCSSGTEDTGTGGSSGGGTGGSTGVAGSAGGSTGAAGSPGAAGGPAGSPGIAGGPAGSPGVAGAAAGSGGSVAGSGGSVAGSGGGSVAGSSGGSGPGGATAGRGGSGTAGSGPGGSSGGSSGGVFTLTSPDHVDGAKFAKDFTCDANNGTFGAGVNPELNWANVPAGTKSFAMTFIDTTIGEDMQMGQHWAIWNIPWDPATGKVATFPKGTKTLTGDLATAKQSGTYLTPCAQSLKNNMDDQYEIRIYALSTATLAGVTNVATAVAALKPTALTPLGKAVLHGHAGLKGK